MSLFIQHTIFNFIINIIIYKLLLLLHCNVGNGFGLRNVFSFEFYFVYIILLLKEICHLVGF